MPNDEYVFSPPPYFSAPVAPYASIVAGDILVFDENHCVRPVYRSTDRILVVALAAPSNGVVMVQVRGVAQMRVAQAEGVSMTAPLFVHDSICEPEERTLPVRKIAL